MAQNFVFYLIPGTPLKRGCLAAQFVDTAEALRYRIPNPIPHPNQGTNHFTNQSAITSSATGVTTWPALGWRYRPSLSSAFILV